MRIGVFGALTSMAVAAALLTACGGGGGGGGVLPASSQNAKSSTGTGGTSSTPAPSDGLSTPTPGPNTQSSPAPTASPKAGATSAPTATTAPATPAPGTPAPGTPPPTSNSVSSACAIVSPSNCVAIADGGTIPYDAPLVLHLASGPVTTTASVSPAATTYGYGGVGHNSVAIRWRRAPGTMYTVTSNGAVFHVTTANPVAMPAISGAGGPPGRYCVMGHTWTLEYQTIRVGSTNQPDTAKNALIDSAEQQAANAGATCARVEIQASFIWGGTVGNLDGTNADFSRYDYIATHLAQHGISMMPTIIQYGGSRIQSTVGMNKAFTSATDYATYATTVTRWIVQHNAQMAAQGLPQITTIELMNEPNQSYWFMDSDTGAGIASFLKAGYAAVKSVDPNLFVYGPGLANGGGQHTNLFSDLSNIYAAGCRIGVCWDGLSIHNFAWQTDPTVYYGPTYEAQWQNYKGVESIAASNGDSGVKICLTETGFASDTSAWGEDPQVAARDMSLAYGLAAADPQIGCVVNASIWDGDDGGGPFAAIGLGDISSGAFVADPRYQVFQSWAR